MSGLQPSQYTGQSYRIGAATTSTSVGLPPWLIKTLGQWSSDWYERYIQCPHSLLSGVSCQLLKCIWQIFFVCLIKSPQCTDKYSKKRFSFPVFWCTKSIKFHFWWGTKPRDQKRLWRQFRTLSLAKNRFLQRFLIFSIKQHTIVPFLSKLISSQ